MQFSRRKFHCFMSVNQVLNSYCLPNMINWFHLPDLHCFLNLGTQVAPPKKLTTSSTAQPSITIMKKKCSALNPVVASPTLPKANLFAFPPKNPWLGNYSQTLSPPIVYIL